MARIFILSQIILWVSALAQAHIEDAELLLSNNTAVSLHAGLLQGDEAVHRLENRCLSQMKEAPFSAMKLSRNLGERESVYGAQEIFNAVGQHTICVVTRAIEEQIDFGKDSARIARYIGAKRALAAYLQKSQRTEHFGLWRNRNFVTPLTLEYAALGDRIIAKLGADLSQGKEGYRHNHDLNLASWAFFRQAADSQNPIRTFRHKSLYVTLSAFYLFDGVRFEQQGDAVESWVSYNEGKPFIGFVHMPVHEFPTAEKILAAMFEEYSVSASLQTVAPIHFLLANYTPHLRGGGTIAEWFSIALMAAAKVPFSVWTKEVWAEAVALEYDDFIEQYPSFLRAPQ